MLSSAYQMNSEVTDEQREKDPENRLLSRFGMRRMTVEEIRDSLLYLDGSLDLTMGGSLQSGQGTDNEFSDARKSLHPDNTKRRTVYLPLRIQSCNALHSFRFWRCHYQHGHSLSDKCGTSSIVHDEQRICCRAITLSCREAFTQ